MKKIFVLTILLFSFLFVGSSLKAASASLFLSPPSGTYTIDNNFAVVVKVNSGGDSINAAEGTLIFNPAEVQVTSLSKSGSIFGLWTTEPIFSNSSGTIVFGGGTPSNFTGSSGTILTINFKAKSVASAQVNFSSGSVLAANGQGTNILGSMQGGLYAIKSRITNPPAEEVQEIVPPSTPDGVPAAPIVFSSTHPEEDKWYANNDPEFSWELPPDVTGVSVLLHEKPTANPGFQSDGLITSKKFEDVADGAWYFHIKFRNQYGWGAITHRKVLIDTTPPTIFKIVVDKAGILTNPSPVLYFESTDVPSGIEYYEVVIDREKKILAKAETAAVADIRRNPFQAPLLAPGNHIVEVKAFDMAANFSLTKTEIEITPIESPEITKIPISIKTGDTLEIEGKALPGMTVRIYLQKGQDEPILEKVKTDSEGNFVFNYDNTLSKGDYLVWAQAEDEMEALSNPTKKYPLEVGLSPILKLGRIVIDYLTVIISLIVLIVGVIAVVFYIWYRISLWRKKLKKETKEVKESVTRAFHALRDEVQEQIEYLDKERGLNQQEKKVRDKLKKALDMSEDFVNKEIKDVEKELK